MISDLKDKMYAVIFEHETKAGRYFDLGLIFFVLTSVLVVALETVEKLNMRYEGLFRTLEWSFTILFTIELIARLFCVRKKWKYLFSFYGVVDLLSILPSYLAFFIPGTQGFLVFRSMRLLRVFRILKLNHYTKAGSVLTTALQQSIPKITVFLMAVSTLVVIVGALIYFIEGKVNGFTSIPKGIYWAIVTITTVGYGDITPQTVLGQMLSSVLMIVGYGIIAVPTGIVSAEIAKSSEMQEEQVCPHCKETIKPSIE